jgi:hypothetical protein
MTKDFSTEHAVASYGRAYIPLQCCVQVEIAELGPPQKMKTRFYTASADSRSSSSSPERPLNNLSPPSEREG